MLKKQTRMLLEMSDTSSHVRNYKIDPKTEWLKEKKDLEIRTKMYKM